MKNVYIYGTGRIGNRYYNSVSHHQFNVLGFVETKKSMETFRNLPVYSVDEIINNDYDEIHLANMYLDTFIELEKRNISQQKIVICNYDLYLQYAQYTKGQPKVKMGFPTVLTQPVIGENILNTVEFTMGENLILGNMDYCRYGTLQLIADEIKRKNVDGETAELGVFRGDFAKFINQLFPDRKLYLFDTFKGFAPEQKMYETENKYAADSIFIGDRDFKNTSVELVMGKMKFPEQCIVKKGMFPDTIPNEEHKYAFVSIDCDLYVPVLEGLKYFYPRLSVGGYIMLHDYNSIEFTGMKKAVDECEKIFGHIVRVPIPDKYGSLVISK